MPLFFSPGGGREGNLVKSGGEVRMILLGLKFTISGCFGSKRLAGILFLVDSFYHQFFCVFPK